ncbi:MAG: hypothetical protein ACRC6K_02875 [Fusobacteriaceae bacterium]
MRALINILIKEVKVLGIEKDVENNLRKDWEQMFEEESEENNEEFWGTVVLIAGLIEHKKAELTLKKYRVGGV